MTMDHPQKLPPARVDALAERLQGSLQRRRPRTWLFVIAAVVIAAGGLGLLAWWLRLQPPAPRLEVIAFDDIAAPNETPHVTAQLVFPDAGDYSPSLLQGREIIFFNAPGFKQPGQQQVQATVVTDEHGRAVVPLTLPDGARPNPIHARYIDAQAKSATNDLATLVRWETDRKILLVDVEEALGEAEPARWEAAFAAGIPVRPQAALALQEAQRKQYQIGYLTVSVTGPLGYRTVRGWVHAPRPDKERLPPGPVLGRRDYTTASDAEQARRARVNDLKTQFGNNITLVARTRAAAATATAAGIRVIILDPGVLMAGVLSVPGWAEVPPLLDP
jgi:hypothetical protein